MDPFTGTWIANLAKSRRHANHQFQSATMRFEVSGNAISLTHGGVNMSGKNESGTLTLLADGEAHPVPAQEGVVVVTRWIGTHEIETVGKRGDQTLGRGTYEVSADGRTLTARVEGTDAQGAAFDQEIVFVRE